MEFQITIAGEAGQGIARSADLVSRDFVSRGMYVFNYRDYGSLIKGGENFNILRISTKKIHSNNWKNDYLVAFGRFSDHHLQKMNKDGISIGTLSKIKNKVDAYAIARELKAPPIVINSVLLGALYKSMNQPLKGLLKQMEVFGKKAKINQKAAQLGYDRYQGDTKHIIVPKQKNKKYFVSGSEAVAYGAVAAGIDLYLAYPMTPATPILHILANLKGHNISVVQLDNEIGVANGALGASYSGATTMVGTSGGGFALMGEALSLQGMSEVPMVVYLAMRPGPASGIPTYSGQGDLKFVLNAGHGDFSKIVVAPGDPVEAFERTVEAVYLSNKYNALTIILSDKHLAESNYTLDNAPSFTVKPSRFLVKPNKKFKSYKITKDGVSPRAPAGSGLIRATSYEHDEFGYTTEDPKEINKMVEKRLVKAKTLEKAVSKLKPIKTYGRGHDLIVSWGSTKGAIIDTLKEVDAKFLQICYLKPFPSRKVKALLESARRVVVVENSATGQIADVIAENTGYIIDKKILKYDGRPFGHEELVKSLRRVLK
ncbi:MAG: 2-oxoacid:acceptor oxidoreductase subunit alpha [Candidatus Altiarchaeota archaeon]|nr:2-oxoacid:acceptor oxidoreductase subunit alpha [Candidatus Altiarchaeota archaeon]